MNLDVDNLQTLLAVVDAGSFDDASIDLGLTPSAVSQRIKALETKLGAVLLVRSRPVVPTTQGNMVLRYARQIAALSEEFTHEIAQDGLLHLAVAVNADSLSTWFEPVFEDIAARDEYAVELLRTDENHSLTLLRTGRVSAVVTTSEQPAQGCTARRLGAMRYRAVASPALVRRYFATDPLNGLAAAPMLVFDREDPLQHDMLRRLGVERNPTTARVNLMPDSSQFVRAIEAGMGWGMVPEAQLENSSNLEVINENWSIDVPLYFQRWALESQALTWIEQCILAAAHKAGLDLLA